MNRRIEINKILYRSNERTKVALSNKMNLWDWVKVVGNALGSNEMSKANIDQWSVEKDKYSAIQHHEVMIFLFIYALK